MSDTLKIDEAALMGASRDELIKLAKQVSLARVTASKIGPQTDDELHAFIKAKWGLHLPRVAVSPGMSAPFDFISDVYFHRETSVIAVANREGGKTNSAAIIHALFANFYPGYEGISAGAIGEQTKRVYQSLKRLNKMWGQDKVKESQATHIEWLNGSVVEPKDGTAAQMNGPHSWLLHRDEIEQFRREAFNEADNITKSGATTDGRMFPATDIYTTSRKKAHGLLQEMLDKVEDAEKGGTIPPYKVYIWGVAETIQNQPDCQMAPENAGRPSCDLCNCDRYVNGKLSDGSPRSLAKVCGGRFFKSDGWRPREPDISGKFMANSAAMWDAQQECSKPATEGLILGDFSKETHGIQGWVPHPEIGKVYQSADFGGTNAQSANWYQYVEKMTSAIDYSGNFIIIPADSYVVFGEVYMSEIGNNKFANLIKDQEATWKSKIPFFEIEERYADIAAKSARLDFLQTHGLRTAWRITREINEHILIIQDLVSNKRIFVDSSAPMWAEEAESWQWDGDTGKQLDTFNHAMSNARYGIANIERKLISEKRHPQNRNMQIGSSAPVSSGQVATNSFAQVPNTGPVTKKYMSGSPHESNGSDLPIHQGPRPAFGMDRMM